MLAHHYNDWDNTDELLSTYSVDGGNYQNLMSVQSITDPEMLVMSPEHSTLISMEVESCVNVVPALTKGTGIGTGCVVVSSDFATFVTNSID